MERDRWMDRFKHLDNFISLLQLLRVFRQQALNEKNIYYLKKSVWLSKTLKAINSLVWNS